jgi:hypothetical protein
MVRSLFAMKRALRSSICCVTAAGSNLRRCCSGVQVRVRDQSEHRQGARHRGATDAARPHRRGDRMSSRRAFITLLGGSAAAWPGGERAAAPGSMRCIRVMMDCGGRSGGASPSPCVLGVGRARPSIPARRPRDSTLRRRNIAPPVAPKNPTHRQRKIDFVSEYLSERDAVLRYG